MIFISYAREDGKVVRRLADALVAKDYEVWWDSRIEPGKGFDVEIAAALAAAKCVLVLWTPDSIGSHWVKEEAAEALARGILLPIAILGTSPPIGFRRLQTLELKEADLTLDTEIGLALAAAIDSTLLEPSGVVHDKSESDLEVLFSKTLYGKKVVLKDFHLYVPHREAICLEFGKKQIRVRWYFDGENGAPHDLLIEPSELFWKPSFMEGKLYSLSRVVIETKGFFVFKRDVRKAEIFNVDEFETTASLESFRLFMVNHGAPGWEALDASDAEGDA